MPESATAVQMHSNRSKNENVQASHDLVKLFSFQNSCFKATHTLFSLINNLVKPETYKETVYLSTNEEFKKNS